VDVIPGLDDFYVANPTIQASIDSAYGGHPTYLTELATHDPEQIRTSIANMAGRIRFDVQASDELISWATVAPHAAAVGAEVYTHVGLHGDAYTQVPSGHVAQWLASVVN
jgi:hypothetical protein